MSEDIYGGEHSVVPNEPAAGDYEPEVRFFRSVAALGVVYGTAGVMALPFGILRFHQGAIPGDYMVHLMDQPVPRVTLDGLWLVVSSLTGAGLALALMVGGIGGVQLRSWSAQVLKLWAIGSIIFGAAGSYFYFRWILPPWREELAQIRGVVDSLVNLGGWMLGSALAVAMLIVLSRQSVRAALARNGKIL